jgi:thioredoxin reductase (NADPH)
LTPQEVAGVRVEDRYRIVTLADGSELTGDVLLISTGVSYRTLGVPGVERLTGKGVYYGAAITEALSCKDDDVFIVGGANSAGQGAMFFSQHARSVTLLVRGSSLAKEMSRYLIKEIEETPNIKVRTSVEVAEALGDEHLEAIILRNRETGATERHEAAGLFIFIGAEPHTAWLGPALARDERGYLLTGPELPRGRGPGCWPLAREPLLMESSLPGVFVAGDVRHGSVKRVASGVGEGAIAVSLIHRYLAGL